MSIPHFIYSFISLFISYFILSIILFYLFFHKLDIGDILWLYEQYGCKHLCCRFFYRHRFSVFFGMYLGMEWLGHMITLSNIFRNCHNIFQSSCTISHPHQPHVSVPTWLLSVFCFIFFMFLVTLSACKVVSHYGFDLHFSND